MEELERSVDALFRSTTDPLSGSRLKIIIDLVQKVVLDTADNADLQLRPVLHRLLAHVGADHGKVQSAIVHLLLNNYSSMSLRMVGLLLDCIALSYRNNDDRFERTVAGRLVGLCENDRRCTLAVLNCLSQFSSCRRRCIDFILFPVIEEDTLALIQTVVPLLQTTEEAVTVLELIAEEASCHDDMDRVLALCVILCKAWIQPGTGDTIASTYTKCILQEQTLSALDMMLLFQFPIHGEPFFRRSLEKESFPFQLAEEVLRSVPENHSILRYHCAHWMLFFLATPTAGNNIEGNKGSFLPMSFLLALYEHQSKTHDCSTKRDLLLMLLHFSDAVHHTQRIVYNFFLHLYQDETKDVSSLWQHLVNRILQTQRMAEEDVVDPTSDIMLCRNISLMMRDDPELGNELDCLLQKLLFSTTTQVVRGIQLAICCLELEVVLPDRWHQWILRILAPPSRRTIDPLVGSRGLVFLDKSTTTAIGQAGVFAAIKMMVANAGLVQTLDHRREHDENWVLGYEQIPNDVSFTGRRMLFTPKTILQQIGTSSHPSRLVPTFLWVHNLLNDYIGLGRRDVRSWRPDGWLLASIAFPAVQPALRLARRLTKWMERHLFSFDFDPPKTLSYDEPILESLMQCFRKNYNVEVLLEVMQQYIVGLLASLAMSTAVVRNVLSDLSALPTQEVVLTQLFKLYDLAEKVNRTQFFLSKATDALEQNRLKEKQRDEDRMDDSKDAHGVFDDHFLQDSVAQTKAQLWGNSPCMSHEALWQLVLLTSESALSDLSESIAHPTIDEQAFPSLFLMDRLASDACSRVDMIANQTLLNLPVPRIFQLAGHLLAFLSATQSGNELSELQAFLHVANTTRCCLGQICAWINNHASKQQVIDLIREFSADKSVPPTQSTKILFDDLAKQLTEYIVYPVFDSAVELLNCFTSIHSDNSLKAEVLHLSWSNLCSEHARDGRPNTQYYSCPWITSSAVSYLVGSCRPTKDQTEEDGLCQSIVSKFLEKARRQGDRESAVFFVFRLSLLRHWGLLLEAQNTGVDSAPHIGRIATTLDLQFITASQATKDDSQLNDTSIKKSLLGFVNPDASESCNIFLQLLHGYVLGAYVIEFNHQSSYGTFVAMLVGFKTVVQLFLEYEHTFARKSKVHFIQVCSDMLRITVNAARRMADSTQDVALVRPAFEEMNTSLFGSHDLIFAEWKKKAETTSAAMTSRKKSLKRLLQESRRKMTEIAASIDNAYPDSAHGAATHHSDTHFEEEDDDDDASFGAAGDWGRDSGSVSTRSTGLNLETTMMMQS